MHSGNLEWSEGMVLGEYSFILSHCMLLFSSHPVVSNSLRPHRLRHARLPCCSLSPQSLLKLLSIESMVPSNHLILCHPLLLLPSIFPSIRVFSNELTLCIRWPKDWRYSFTWLVQSCFWNDWCWSWIIFDHLMWRVNSLEKTLMLGKIEGRRKRGWRDEMVGWHHQFNGHELGQTPGDGEEQGGLACSSPWGQKESDMTWQLNNKN